MRAVLSIIVVCAFAFVGCEGDRGPQGPAGPPGPPGPSTVDSEFSYAGNQGEPCLHCHSGTVETWMSTGHAEATTDLAAAQQDNPYCMQCHTTGWDRPIEFGEDFDTVPAGPDTSGYDDYFRVDTELAQQRRAALTGVQCESCHGPMGPNFNENHAEISFSTRFEVAGSDTTSTSLCAPCHDNQLVEWATSGHSFYNEETMEFGDIDLFNDEHYVGIPSCESCHTSEGFIRANDPVYQAYDFGDRRSFIGCVTCHDPHVGVDGGGNEAQLRALGAVEVRYTPGTGPGEPTVPVMEGRGTGQTCAQCHHARRDTENVQSQIANGYAHFGPHSSPQMDMFIGYGSYEIPGFTYTGRYDQDPTTHFSGTENACVNCHMAPAEGETHTPHFFYAGGPEWNGCTDCHSASSAEGLYNSLRTQVEGKLDQIAVLLGFTDRDDFAANFDSQAAGVTVVQREAAYAAVFVMDDGSYGVHNPDYAVDLLDNAIAYLSPARVAGTR